MPLPQRVRYPESIEPLVQFIEDTPPSEILDRTLEKLRSGVPTEIMLEASALAVTRSSTLPPAHHASPLPSRPPRRPPAPAGRPLCALEPGQAAGRRRRRPVHPGRAACRVVEQAH